MISLLTNSAASTALLSLNATQKNLTKTENEASTGLKISTASDNAAYWSIAEQMSSENSGVQTVSDDLNQSLAIANVTYTALTSISKSVNAIKQDLIAATQPGADRASIQTDIEANQNSIIMTANDATFNGQNWLVDNWTIDNSSTYETDYTGVSSQADLESIQQNYNGSYSQISTQSSTGSYSDTWGNSASGSNSLSTNYNFNFYQVPNGLGPNGDGIDFHEDYTDSSSSTSTPTALVPESFSHIPINYNQGLVSFSNISESQFKLFDNYSGSDTSQEIVTYNGVPDPDNPVPVSNPTETYSSYQSAPTGISYDPSLPEQGLGLLTEGTDVAQVTSYTLPVTTAPASANRLIINNVPQTPPPATGPQTVQAVNVSSVNILNLDVTTMSDSDIANSLTIVNDVLNTLDANTETLGADINSFSNQQSFLSSLSDSYTNGVSSLVDADMNQVSTRLAALQVQQQLGVQALGIANSNTQLILKLFQ